MRDCDVLQPFPVGKLGAREMIYLVREIKRFPEINFHQIVHNKTIMEVKFIAKQHIRLQSKAQSLLRLWSLLRKNQFYVHAILDKNIYVAKMNLKK